MSDTVVEVVELYGEKEFPVDIARKPPPSFNFAAGSAQPLTGDRRYRFGLANAEMAAQLRILADMLDAKQAVPQTVYQVTKASNDDFVMHWVTLEFATRADLPE